MTAQDVILRTNTSDPALALRDVQRFADGSGFRTLLVVRSRGFGAERSFHVEPGPLVLLIEALERMDRTLSGAALLKPHWEEDFLELQMGRLGRVMVRGELHESSASPQHLRFEFETDQTCLAPLVTDIRACLRSTGT
jgi:hypothetical protein